MIEISCEINGKKINPRDIENSLEQAMFSSITDSIKKSLGDTRCSKHGQSPKIKIKGGSLDSLNVEAFGCCDDLIKKVRTKLK